MTFEDLWAQVDGLPNTAKVQIPEVLSDSTKKKLSRHRPGEVVSIITSAIDEVNQGSITSLDELIRKQL